MLKRMPDLTAADLDAAVRTVAGSARSMGIEVRAYKMARLSNRYKAIAGKIDRNKTYQIDEALGVKKSCNS